MKKTVLILIVSVLLSACGAPEPTATPLPPVEVTRQVVVTQLVDVTRQVEVVKPVEVTKLVEVTRIVVETSVPTETQIPVDTLTPQPTAAPPTSAPAILAITAQGVINQFNSAGLGLVDVRSEPRDSSSPLPNSYKEQLAFSIPEVAPKGGQVFVCDTKKNCDALYAYFDALKALAGPYLYQSPGGRVVVQLNSGLAPDTGAKFEAVVNTLP
jgi:hypothetical protein